MIETILTIILAPVALAAIVLVICIAIGTVKAFKKDKKVSKTIYCGDEYTTEFLQNSLTELLDKVSCETIIIDGEYHLKVEI